MKLVSTVLRNQHKLALLSLPLIVALGAACSSENTPAASGGSAGSTGGSGGSSATGGSGGTGGSAGSGGSSAEGGIIGEYYGLFQVSFKQLEPAFTQMGGRVFKSAQPPSILLKEDLAQNGCHLMVPKSTFCSPKCDNGVCVNDNECVHYSDPVSVGMAKVSGMTGGDFTMSLSSANIYTALPTLPATACAEGGDVKIVTEKFTLQGKCIAPLVIPGSADPIPVKKGAATKLSWKAPATPDASRMEIHLDISHHGGKTGEINCDVPDTGSFDIPEPLVTRLVSLGVAGFPTITLRRYTRTSSPTQSEVKIQIDSDLERDVDTGVVSCTDTTMCPPGQTCQADLTCK